MSVSCQRSPEEEAAFSEALGHLLELYADVKEYVLASERAVRLISEANGGATVKEGDDQAAYVKEGDDQGPPIRERFSIPAINELRSAFDHEMRAQGVFCGRWDREADVPTDMDYCLQNLSKARAHVYRAGYDALDVLIAARLVRVDRIVEEYPVSILEQGLPSGFAAMDQQIQHAINLSLQAKRQKDVEDEDEERQDFERYREAAKELDRVHDVLASSVTYLSKLRAEREKEKGQARRATWFAAAIGWILAAVLAVLSVWLGRRS